MATLTERLSLIIDASASGAIRQIKDMERATATAATEQKNLTTQGGFASRAMQRLGLDGANTGTLLKTALVGGAVTAAAGIGKFALDSVDKFASLTAEVRKFQRVSGASAEDASRLVFAVKRLGIEPDVASAAIGRMSVNLGTGKVDLRDWGVQVDRNKDGSVSYAGTLENLADHFSKMKDVTERNTEAQKLFGKSYQQILPLLSKSRGDLEAIFALAAKQGHIFSEKDLELGKQYSLAMRDLKTSWEQISIQVGRVAAPVVSEFAKGLTNVVSAADGATSAFGGISGAVKFGLDVSPIGNFNNAVTGVSDIVNGDLGGGLEHLAKSLPIVGNIASGITDLFGGGGDAATTFKDKTDAANAAMQKVADLAAQGKQGTAEYAQAVRDASAANRDLAGTQKAVNEAMQDTAVKSQAAAQAVLGKWAADINASNAAIAVKTAQDQYNQSLKDHGPASIEAQQAENNLETAVLNEASAVGDRAVAALGANATQKEKNAAKTRGMIDALTFLAATTNGPVHDAIIKEIGDLQRIPADKSTRITVDSVAAEAALARLNGALARFNANKPTAADTLLIAGGNPAAQYSGAGHTPVRNIFTGEITYKAAGGPVAGMAPYIVGERGPELFTPRTSGWITPNSQLGGTVNWIYNITVEPGMMTNADVGSVVVDSLKAYERSNGSGWRK